MVVDDWNRSDDGGSGDHALDGARQKAFRAECDGQNEPRSFD
jgi:hypothetical protein